MAVYHLKASVGSRGGGQSAAAKNAYVCREGRYAGDAEELLHREDGNMPQWAADEPGEYWQAADDGERANGSLYREVQFALPQELSESEQVELAREFAQSLTTNGERLPYTLAVHRGDGENPHAHLVMSERVNDGQDRTAETWFKRHNARNPERGGARKSRAAMPREWLTRTRKDWERRANEALERSGSQERIDRRSWAERREDAMKRGDLEEAARCSRKPNVHLGPRELRHHDGKEQKDQRVRGENEAAVGARDKSTGEIAAQKTVIARIEQELRRIEREVRRLAKRVVELAAESLKIERQAAQRGGVKRREFTDGRNWREVAGVALKRLHERQAWEQTKPLRDEQRSDLNQQHRQQWIKLYERQEGEIAWLDQHSRTEEGRKEMAEEASRLKKVHGKEFGADDVLQRCREELEEMQSGRREEVGRQQGQELETLGEQQQIDYQNALLDPLRKETVTRAALVKEFDRQLEKVSSGGGFGQPDGDFNLESIAREQGIELERSWERERSREIGPSL